MFKQLLQNLSMSRGLVFDSPTFRMAVYLDLLFVFSHWSRMSWKGRIAKSSSRYCFIFSMSDYMKTFRGVYCG